MRNIQLSGVRSLFSFSKQYELNIRRDGRDGGHDSHWHAVFRAHWNDDETCIVNIEQNIFLLNCVDFTHATHVAGALGNDNVLSATSNALLHIFTRRSVPFYRRLLRVQADALRKRYAFENMLEVDRCSVAVPLYASAFLLLSRLASLEG